MMLVDYHVHTEHSDDCIHPMESMIKRAIEIGIDEIAFTEHVDFGIKSVINCDFDKYFESVQKMRRVYGNRINIVAGAEFGVQNHTIHLYEEEFERYPFDFILMSNHQIEDKELFTLEFQKGKSQDEFQRAYYSAILDVIEKYKNYSVLGHLDVIKRYDDYGLYPDSNIMDIVDRILIQVIEDEKGIEVNTSGYFYGFNDTFPSTNIIERYYDLGGRIITIGSDAHHPDHLADCFAMVKENLARIGFKGSYTYRRMKATFCPF